MELRLAARKHSASLALVLAGLLAIMGIVTAKPVFSGVEEPPDSVAVRGTVVLLHGLIRKPGSMKKMARALRAAGYRTCNIGYPSTDFEVEILAGEHVLPAIQRCVAALPVDQQSLPLNFVTHSMGGIIVRQLAATNALASVNQSIGRVVMLGTPNNGSELVDSLSDWWLFNRMNGPAGSQLGTDKNALPLNLGKANFELGVIAGNRSFSLLSRLVPGEDDGKVAVSSTRLEGMQDFIVMPATHTFMMQKRSVINQALSFLNTGQFAHDDDSYIEEFSRADNG